MTNFCGSTHKSIWKITGARFFFVINWRRINHLITGRKQNRVLNHSFIEDRTETVYGTAMENEASALSPSYTFSPRLTCPTQGF